MGLLFALNTDYPEALGLQLFPGKVTILAILLNLSHEVDLKRECLLKCLIVYLGEDVDKLIK
ncbi:hypothetical protein CRUP_023671 [Coryphaenoides rupestris]|nr:hypothetical protein CRUP_023671 [Coryphaenoides rupestris]